MLKEIREVDKERGIVRVTTPTERWYVRDKVNPETGLPQYEFVPSVTWICEHYPKGVAFYKWLASKGWDEAEAIKTAAGDRGSRVHYAIRDLIEGKSVAIDAKYKTAGDEKETELSLEEYDCVMSFAAWHKENKPEFLGCEFVVYGEGYAGTVDLLCKIGGVTYLVDFKTSQYIWPSHELQVSAYKRAYDPAGEIKDMKLAILQVGYRLNKKRFKFTEVEDQYNEFLAAKTIWAKEQKGVEPHQKDYPLRVKLDLTEKKEKINETAKAR
jgi:ATP-dependent exoDNAse (exonuclease V) beta subunit